ncbi:hypothetical protein PG997_009119 [Apiospora hydei]|uniref:Uncharacterized protein n=1 Tax=Apiospora hydei TaxID=1337664 RepID=A0ABR1VT72_9PEZI
MPRSYLNGTKLGPVGVFKLLAAAYGLLLAAELIYIVVQCIMVYQLSQIESAGGSCAVALKWTNDFRELPRALQLAQSDAGVVSDALARVRKKRKDPNATQQLVDGYSKALIPSIISWAEMSDEIVDAARQIGAVISLLQGHMEEVSGFHPAFRYALGHRGDAGYLLLQGRIQSSVDAATEVLDRVGLITGQARGNFTTLLMKLGYLMEVIEKDHQTIQLDQRYRLKGGHMYLCNLSNMCGLIGSNWISEATLQELQVELFETKQTLDHTFKLARDAYKGLAVIMFQIDITRKGLVEAKQANTWRDGSTAERNFLINSKRWTLELRVRIEQLSDLQHQYYSQTQNETAPRKYIDCYSRKIKGMRCFLIRDVNAPHSKQDWTMAALAYQTIQSPAESPILQDGQQHASVSFTTRSAHYSSPIYPKEQ